MDEIDQLLSGLQISSRDESSALSRSTKDDARDSWLAARDLSAALFSSPIKESILALQPGEARHSAFPSLLAQAVSQSSTADLDQIIRTYAQLDELVQLVLISPLYIEAMKEVHPDLPEHYTITSASAWIEEICVKIAKAVFRFIEKKKSRGETDVAMEDGSA